MEEQENGWKPRTDEARWNYWQDGKVVAIVSPEGELPVGWATPATRWGVVAPNSLFELQSYPYETREAAQREAERRLKLGT